MRQIGKISPLVAAIVMLGGCVNLSGKVPSSLLTLTSNATVPGGDVRSGAREDAIVVMMLETPRKLDNNRVAVQIDATNTAYIPEVVWADKPASLFQQLLAETLAAKTNRLVLTSIDASGRQKAELGGQLLEFGVDTQSMQAVVIFDAVKIEAGKPLQRQRFEKRISVALVEAGPSATALNQAANDVAQAVSQWIGDSASK